MQTGYVVLPRNTQPGSDALKKRLVVHALDNGDWTPRFLRNSPLSSDWFNLLIGLIRLERDWCVRRRYVVRGCLSGRWIAFGQLTPRETKFHPDLNRIPFTYILGCEHTLEDVYVFAAILRLKLSSNG